MMGNPLSAVRIIESPLMVERVLHAKSPSRARRRERLGYPQHYVERPQKTAHRLSSGTLVMHPQMAAALRARLKAAR